MTPCRIFLTRARPAAPLLQLLLLLAMMLSPMRVPAADCIDPSAAAIAGLHPGMPESSLAGRPLQRSNEPVKGEDDGGTYLGARYLHPDYEVIIVRGSVDEVSTASVRISWYRGIKTGMRRQQVGDLLARTPVATQDAVDTYAVCSVADDAYALLYYRGDSLIRIRLIQERP